MKKNVRVFLPLLLIIIIFITIYYVKVYHFNETPEAVLEKSFSYSGAKIVNSEIYFWGRLDTKYNEFEKLKKLADTFSNELGIIGKDRQTSSAYKNDSTSKVEIRGVTKFGYTADISVQVDTSVKNGNERFISVLIADDSTYPKLDTVRKDVLEVFSKYGIHPKINSCITGSFDGKLSDSQINDVFREIFKGVDAKKVEGVRDGNLISISAFSPFISNSIKANGSKINLNLATRFNSTEGRTYIWIATPVITIEY